jgi:hypothetical protein
MYRSIMIILENEKFRSKDGNIILALDSQNKL